jgi:transketolase
MRNVFCQSLVEAAVRPEFVFLTGDLGFKALEPLRDALDERFINAGVAEQNMVSVAAGLARNGLRPWVYSIAPFVYARPFEQIRNDVCLHRLPVVLVGNGGGYGYGVMGATHHALEDYGALLCLPALRAYIPAFDADLRAQVRALFDAPHPAYLRLGLSEEPAGAAIPPYAPWRKLEGGREWTVLVVGTLVGGIWNAVRSLDEAGRPNLWSLCELPFDEMPDAFRADVARTRRLLVVEEHVAQGGAGRMVAAALLKAGLGLEQFAMRSAQGYISGRYGSQKFHRRECGLDPESIVHFLTAGSLRDAG